MKMLILFILAFMLGGLIAYMGTVSYFMQKERECFILVQSLQSDLKAETTMLGNPQFISQ